LQRRRQFLNLTNLPCHHRRTRPHSPLPRFFPLHSSFSIPPTLPVYPHNFLLLSIFMVGLSPISRYRQWLTIFLPSRAKFYLTLVSTHRNIPLKCTFAYPDHILLSPTATEKHTETGKNARFAYGLSEMQGWRLSESRILALFSRSVVLSYFLSFLSSGKFPFSSPSRRFLIS
jgi:hypothetical protein